MKRLKAVLGNVGAILTVVAAVLAPFLLYGVFTKAFAKLPLRVDEMYSGGPKIRSVQMANYTIDIHQMVSPHMLQREKAFVQLDWKPVASLPERISDQVDIDGDGTPDVKVSFDAAKDPRVLLRVNVEPLNPRYESLQNAGREKFSALIVRVDDAILVRIPVKN